MKTLKIKHNIPNPLSVPDLVHTFRNFGEDVFRSFRDSYVVSLDEIDKATSEFHIRGIHKREVRSVIAKVRNLIEKEYPTLPPIEIVEANTV
jgi:hypothetical protein